MCVFAPQREMEFVANGCNICSLITVCAACFPYTQLFYSCPNSIPVIFQSSLLLWFVCKKLMFFSIMFFSVTLECHCQFKLRKRKQKITTFPPNIFLFLSDLPEAVSAISFKFLQVWASPKLLCIYGMDVMSYNPSKVCFCLAKPFILDFKLSNAEIQVLKYDIIFISYALRDKNVHQQRCSYYLWN